MASLGLAVARERRWLAEEGLAVEERYFGDEEIRVALAAGALEVGLVSPVAQIRARTTGADLRAIAAGAAELRGASTRVLFVRPDAGIRAARELEGRVIAVRTLQGADHLAVQSWLQAQGADLLRVAFVELPLPQHPWALVEERVDAILAHEPYTAMAASAGAQRLADPYAVLSPSLPVAYYVAHGGWLGRQAETARRFARALHRANTALDADPVEARAAAGRYLGLTPELASRVSVPRLGTRLDPAGLQWWLDTEQRFLRPLEPSLSLDGFLFDTVR
jgi:NitT/TauT family transport system substrate-binding protein